MSTSWDDIEALARARHPERYAPNGEALVQYSNECRHTSDERIRGLCGDGWQHRLASWERAHAGEPAIPDEDEVAPSNSGRSSSAVLGVPRAYIAPENSAIPTRREAHR